jgi:hypothetical protein
MARSCRSRADFIDMHFSLKLFSMDKGFRAQSVQGTGAPCKRGGKFYSIGVGESQPGD